MFLGVGQFNETTQTGSGKTRWRPPKLEYVISKAQFLYETETQFSRQYLYFRGRAIQWGIVAVGLSLKCKTRWLPSSLERVCLSFLRAQQHFNGYRLFSVSDNPMRLLAIVYDQTGN